MKMCKRCGEMKTFECFVKNPCVKSGIGARCKECDRKARRESYYRNHEHEKSRKKWYVEKIGKGAFLEKRRMAYSRKTVGEKQKYKEQGKRNKAKWVRELHKNYVVHLLAQKIGVHASLIPNSLVEAETERLRLMRLIKQKVKDDYHNY